MLTVTAKGQVTLKKEILHHLGLAPGDRVVLELLPGGCCKLQAARAEGSINSFIGMLAGRGKHMATLDEINAATADGWAGKQ